VQGAVVTIRRRDESGAVLMITVISLVVLLGMAALVVDLGGSYAQRRKMQSSADASAIGAAQNLALGSTSGAAGQAVTIGNENLPKLTPNWNACAGDALPASFTAYAGSNCISFSSDFMRIRVRVPRQTFPTLFGKILGFSNTSTSTVAIAALKAVGNGGNLEPFAVGSTFGAGDYCLDSGGNGNSIAPCDGATTGNFGVLSFAHCGANSGLNDDIAAGADHVYTTNPAGDPALDVADDCTKPGPNTVLTDPGNKVGQETPGLLTGLGPFADGGPARLQRVPQNCSGFSPTWETVSAACGSQGAIDNRPLWEFIPSGLGSEVPTSCHRETFEALLAATAVPLQQAVMHTALTTCIADYVASGSIAPVFTENTGGVVDEGLSLFDIQSSPRFVYAPQVWDPVPANGRKTYEIKAFRAVFIQRTGANNSLSFFEPGPWNGNTLPDSSSAYTAALVLPAPRAGCTPTPTDSCGTMLPGLLGSITTAPLVIGANAVMELVG
jgi:Flp pilus assembly protein TadG